MLKKIKSLITNKNRFLLPTGFKSSDYEAVSISVSHIKSALYSSDISELLQLYATLIQRDLTLSSALNHRKQQLVNLPFTITDKDNEKAWQSILPHLKIPTLISRLGVAIEYGISITDMTWNEVLADDNKTYFLPIDFHTIAPLNLGHDTQVKTGIDDALYLTSSAGKKSTLSSYSPAKLLVHYHPADDTHINRYSPVYKTAWLVALKHHALSRNIQYFDALGVPPLIVKLDTYDEDELKAVLAQVMQTRSEVSSCVLPKEAEIDVLKGQGTKTEFLEFIKYVDEQIQLAINGNTLSSHHAESGSRAQSEVHERRLYEKRDFDARLLEASITRLLSVIAQINFSKSQVRFSFDLEVKQDLLELSQVHKNIADSGFQIPPEQMSQIYGIEGITIRQASDPPQTNHLQPFQPNAQNPDQNQDLKPLEQAINGNLHRILTEASSYDEMLEKLAQNYTNMDLSVLENHLQNYLMNARISANVEVNAENEN